MTEFYKCPRVAIGIPSHDTWPSETGLAVAALTGYMAEKYVSRGELEIRFVTVNGTLIGGMRNAIVRKARELECTHILWIDADMKFPPNAMERLLQRNKPVIGCNYPRRRSPVRPTAAHLPTEKFPKGQLIYQDGQTGIQEIQYMGMGVCLTEMTVFEALPEPWFMIGWNSQTGEDIGEDVHFFRSLPSIGCKVYVDHDLSAEVKHIGQHTYTHQDALDDLAEVLRMQADGNKHLQRASDGDSPMAGQSDGCGPDGRGPGPDHAMRSEPEQPPAGAPDGNDGDDQPDKRTLSAAE